MEAVFKTPELVDLILDHFRVIPSNDSPGSAEDRVHVSREDFQVMSDKEKRRTLFRMALTNRAISHTALSILWVTLDGALPLLKLVSGLRYHETVRKWVLTRSLTQRDFERLEFFSSMVKHIVLSDGRHLFDAIHPSAVFEICMMRVDKPLVPGLKTLWIDDYCDYGAPLLTETLKCVKIVHVHASDEEGENLPSPSVWNLLRLLPGRAPFLEDLHIGSVPSSSNLSDILKLVHLKKLTFIIWRVRHWFTIGVDARYRFLKGLESLPQLRELNVGGLLEDYRSTIDPLMEPRTGCYHFSALETLKMTGFDDHLLKLLTQLPTSHLRELHFESDTDAWDGESLNDYGAEEFRRFGIVKALSFLGEHHFRSLTKLVIDFTFSIFKVEHLRPLLRVSGMRHVNLPPCGGLNDKFILEMATAWSDLECFQVFADLYETPLVQPTLLSLQTFARLCPNLRRISTNVDPNPMIVLPNQPPYRLEHLTLFTIGRNAKITESRVPAVAKFLSATFPALIFAFCRNYGREVDQRGYDWNAVFRMLMHDKDKKEVASLKKMFRMY